MKKDTEKVIIKLLDDMRSRLFFTYHDPSRLNPPDEENERNIYFKGVSDSMAMLFEGKPDERHTWGDEYPIEALCNMSRYERMLNRIGKRIFEEEEEEGKYNDR